MFKSPARVIILFILIFILGDRMLAFAGSYITRYSSFPYARLYNNDLNSHIVILGNSRAYRHFYENDWSKILEKQVANLSVPGAPLIHLEAILDDYVSIYGLPDNIIIELDCLNTNTELLPSFKFLMFFSENYSLLMKEYFKSNYYISNFVAMFKLNSIQYLNSIHKIFVEYEQPKLYNKLRLSDLNDFKVSKKIDRFNSKSYNIKALERILKNYSNKSQINFIISPFHPKVFDKYGDDFEEWKEEINKITKRKINILDYSKSILDDKFFNDPFHLNNLGVTKLKNELLLDNFFKRI